MYHITKRQVFRVTSNGYGLFHMPDSKLYKLLGIFSSFQAFPDALFHQLLLAMAHPDHETRVGAHSIFSLVLMPSPFSPQLDQKTNISQKVPSESFSIQHESFLGAEQINGKSMEGKAVFSVSGKYAVHPYHGHILSGALTDGQHVWNFLLITF